MAQNGVGVSGGIVLEGVTNTFPRADGTPRTVFDELSLNVAPGELVATHITQPKISRRAHFVSVTANQSP